MSSLWYPSVKQSPFQGYTGYGGGPTGLMLKGAGGGPGSPKAWTSDKPSWVDSSFDSLRPYFWSDFESRNGVNGVSGSGSGAILDRSGNGRHAAAYDDGTADWTPNMTTVGTGRGLNGNHTSLVFNQQQGVKINAGNGGGWPGPTYASFITVTAYESTWNNRARIWSGGPGVNWLIGNWSGQTGVAYYNDGFINSSSHAADQGDDFAVYYGHFNTKDDYLFGHKYDGASFVTYTTGGGSSSTWPEASEGVAINYGNHNEKTDGNLLMVGIWDYKLTTTQRNQIVDDVYNKYIN